MAHVLKVSHTKNVLARVGPAIANPRWPISDHQFHLTLYIVLSMPIEWLRYINVSRNDKSTVSVAMKSMMRMRTVQFQSRNEIPTQITRGKSDKRIARETIHCRDLIPEICRVFNLPNDLFTLEHPLGAPQKVPRELMAEADGSALYSSSNNPPILKAS
jgi:hypothetical protein